MAPRELGTHNMVQPALKGIEWCHQERIFHIFWQLGVQEKVSRKCVVGRVGKYSTVGGQVDDTGCRRRRTKWY